MRLRLLLLASVLAALIVAPAASPHTKTAATKLHKSTTIVAWYEGKGSWTLRPGYRYCVQLVATKAERRCFRHRRNLAAHRQRIVRLTPKPAAVRGSLGNVSNWNCIHSHERGAAGWATNTGNGYYGGLQMDYDFMSTYGAELLRAKGTADKWTPAEQMIVAQRAHDGYGGHAGRGYYPWPNTARACGLI